MQDAPERGITTGPVATASRAGWAETRIGRGVTISVEAIVWAGLVLVAGALRLPDLGQPQVTVGEGVRAFDAARVAGGEVPPTWQGDLAQAATSYLFRIFGETELVARLLPALAGVGLVLVLAFTRPHLGRVGALAAATLVAVSPLFVLFSRSVTEFSLGPLVAGMIVVSLFAYLREPRPALLFVLVVALALAPLTDPVAVLAALAAVVFLVVEGLLFSNADVRRAWKAFTRSPLQWVTAVLVTAAALQFGITRFGTSFEGLSPPGLNVLWDMFGSPRDPRPPGYHFSVLSGYDWPLLLAGTAGFLFVAAGVLRRRNGTSPLERLLLLWTLAAAVVVALTTRREATQLLILLTPLALLAGMLAEEVVAGADWGAARRWWPAGAAIIALAGIAAALMTEWSSGNADRAERLILAASVVIGMALLGFVIVRGRAGAVPVVTAVFAVAAAAFLAHSSLAVAFYDGTEFAVDLRLTPSVEPLRQTVDNLARERGGNIVVDADLMDELGWPLRDSPVTFGGPTDRASAVVSRPDANPAGFVARNEIWRVAEGWYPEDVFAPRRMWRWLLYREPYSDVETVEVRIFVRTI